MTKEQVMEMYEKMVHDCAEKEGGSATDIEEVMAHKPPSTKSGKCMHACMAETSGVVRTIIQ